jgi:predicted deacylase
MGEASSDTAEARAGQGGALPAALRDGVVDGVRHVLRIGSGRPHAVIVALTHGNETCGLAAQRAVIAARDRLLRGTVTLIAANVAGHARRDPAAPQAGRFVEADMNRLWSPEGLAGDSIEARRARQIAPLCRQADLLIDLHSMATAGPRLLMFHPSPAALALLPGLPADHHRIRFAAALHDGRLLIEQPGLLGNPACAAFVVECGPHRARSTAAQARRITLALLAAAGLLPPAPPAAPRRRCLDVAAVAMLRAGSDDFRFRRPPQALQIFAQGETIADDGGTPVIAPFAPTALLLPRLRPLRGQEAGILGRLASADCPASGSVESSRPQKGAPP